MSIDEIKKLIKDGSKGDSISNVRITAKSGRKFKQALRVNSLNQLCIGNYNSKFPNYIINPTITDNWKDVEIIK